MNTDIKITNAGWAVVAGDTLLSRDVEEQGRLDVASAALGPLQRYIPRGGTVVDIGACIGDHTVTYANWVGVCGTVHAFEPNPIAFQCLVHNMQRLDQVHTYGIGLGADKHMAVHRTLDTNLGATYLTRADDGDLEVVALDSVSGPWVRCDFIKIDVEGYEPQVLDGAAKTIARFRPVMLVEVNQEMLGRMGRSSTEVLDRVAAMGYLMSYSPKGSYDLLCVPMEKAGLI